MCAFEPVKCLVYIYCSCISIVFCSFQVKVWKTSDGFCFVTFMQHSAGVTGGTFTQTGKVTVSSSLDGTVRAFDMNKSVIVLLGHIAVLHT